jgi:hypothetical protein
VWEKYSKVNPAKPKGRSKLKLGLPRYFLHSLPEVCTGTTGSAWLLPQFFSFDLLFSWEESVSYVLQISAEFPDRFGSTYVPLTAVKLVCLLLPPRRALLLNDTLSATFCHRWFSPTPFLVKTWPLLDLRLSQRHICVFRLQRPHSPSEAITPQHPAPTSPWERFRNSAYAHLTAHARTVPSSSFESREIRGIVCVLGVFINCRLFHCIAS